MSSVLLQDHLNGVDSINVKADFVVSSTEAVKASVRIHLFTLLCEEMKIPCARQLEEKLLVPRLIVLLSAGQEALAQRTKSGHESDKIDSSGTPKWMAPLLLLLDLYEKMALGMRRRSAMEKATSHIWKWFDIVSGKWCPYTAANNKIIDEAFWAGQNSVRVTAGRRRYLLQFSSMIQVNEETANRRPIMLSLKGEIENFFSFFQLNLTFQFSCLQRNPKKRKKQPVKRRKRAWKWMKRIKNCLANGILSTD